MKRLFLILLVAICSMTAVAREVQSSDVRRFNVPQDTNVPFRLFPTQNMWTFLKLDTRTGQIWALQYYAGSEKWELNAYSVDITDAVIDDPIKENIGRFTLYPTSNIYNFILLDQFEGRTWQVEYSFVGGGWSNEILSESQTIQKLIEEGYQENPAKYGGIPLKNQPK